MSHDFEFDFPAVKVSSIKLRDITLVTESFATIEGMDTDDFEEEGMENDDFEEGMEVDDSSDAGGEEGVKEGISSWQRKFNKTFGIRNKSKKKKIIYNKYYHLTAKLDNRNGSSQFFYNKLHYFSKEDFSGYISFIKLSYLSL